MIRRATMALTVMALGTLVACGEDDGGGSGGESSLDEGQEYIDAMVADSDNEGLPAEDIECYARSFVDAVGVDALQGAGVTPEDMSSDASLNDFDITFDDTQVDAFWSDLNECMDVRAFFLESLAADGEISDETVDCLDERMDDDLIKRFIVGAVTEGEDAFQEDDQLTRDLASVLTDCRGALPEG